MPTVTSQYTHAGELTVHNHTYSEGIRQWTELMR